MPTLLLHSADDFNASWTRQRWDRVIDLGRAPQSFYEQQSAALGCPMSSIFDLAVEVEDLLAWRQRFALGMGSVVDRFGIDWWDVISPQLQPELQDVQLALRLAGELKDSRALVASRPSLTAEILRLELGIPAKILRPEGSQGIAGGVIRLGIAAADLGWVQLRQVLFDKYDPHYLWRRKLAHTDAPLSTGKSEPIVLLPSAYSNVTRTALGYARVLPGQKFLLVLARESAAVSPVPANVATASLAGFAASDYDPAELQRLCGAWQEMEQSLQNVPVFRLASQAGIFKKIARRLRWGIAVRDAWIRVFETRTIAACLSADDSNPYTRIPLLLAAQRGLAAVPCHHGALDFGMAFKRLRSSTYLAKGDMESDYLQRACGVDGGSIRLGVPASLTRESIAPRREQAPWLTFFTEPYEVSGWRAEAIYREVLPRLCAVARRSGKSVVIKLHPFESAPQRRRLVSQTLSEGDRKIVSVMKTPLSEEILQKTWCAVTVESTVACECARAGIPSFLCGWLRHAYAGYAAQFVRFGVGTMLDSPTRPGAYSRNVALGDSWATGR